MWEAASIVVGAGAFQGNGYVSGQPPQSLKYCVHTVVLTCFSL